jgi:hypothetical protein
VGVTERTARIAGKIIISGVMGNALFVASILVSSWLIPARGPPYDVVEGWTAALFMIIGMLLSIVLSGIIGVLLTFRDISTIRGAVIVSFLSGIVATIVPQLIGIVIGIYAFDIFLLCLAVLVACDMLAVIGGLVTYYLLSFLNRKKMKQNMPGNV